MSHRPCPTCDGGDPRCLDCRGSGLIRTRAEEYVDEPLIGTTNRAPRFPQDFAPRVAVRPCTWGDDAWHRAVQRLCRIHRGDYIRLLSEERAHSEEAS